MFSGVASAQLQVFDLAACAGEGALPRLLMHRLSQRDPKRSKEHKKDEGCRGLRVNTKRERQEISSRKHQEGHENGRENSSTSGALLLCAFKARFHLSACLSCGRRSDLDDASFLSTDWYTLSGAILKQPVPMKKEYHTILDYISTLVT